MKKNIILIIALTASLAISCNKVLLDDVEPNSSVSNFDLLWEDFDALYGGFTTKNLNWDSLYTIYRPMVNKNSSDEELFQAMTGLLDHLDDSHVRLHTTNPDLPFYRSGIEGRLKTFADFNLDVVKDNYLVEKKQYNLYITYGKLENNIGYIHLQNMNEGIHGFKKAFNDILDYLKSTDGIVLDIRANSGGMDREAVYIAGRFANEEKTAFKFRLRNGPEHNDFTDFYDYTVKPEGKWQYTKNIALLTQRFTISAAETFVLTLKRFDYVTTIGDTTCGAFSDVMSRELPSGWVYSLSVGDWRDFEGRSFEAIGLAPDILIENKEEDIQTGKDEALETAIDFLKIE
jgi:hypothetical protein